MPAPAPFPMLSEHPASLSCTYDNMKNPLPHDSGIADTTAAGPDDVYYSDATLSSASSVSSREDDYDDESDLDELVSKPLHKHRSKWQPSLPAQRRPAVCAMASRPISEFPDAEAVRQQQIMDSSRAYFSRRALPPPPPVSTATHRLSTHRHAPVPVLLPRKGILKTPPPPAAPTANIAPQPGTKTVAFTDNDKPHPRTSTSTSTGTMRRLKNRLLQCMSIQKPKSRASFSDLAKAFPPAPASAPRPRPAPILAAAPAAHPVATTVSRKVKYDKMVIVHDTYAADEYDRSPDPLAACTHLTPAYVDEIKTEVNLYKFDEMVVHPGSRIYTHFYSI